MDEFEEKEMMKKKLFAKDTQYDYFFIFLVTLFRAEFFYL